MDLLLSLQCVKRSPNELTDPKALRGKVTDFRVTGSPFLAGAAIQKSVKVAPIPPRNYGTESGNVCGFRSERMLESWQLPTAASNVLPIRTQ